MISEDMDYDPRAIDEAAKKFIAFIVLPSGAMNMSDNGQYRIMENSASALSAIAAKTDAGPGSDTSTTQPMCKIPTLLIHQPSTGLSQNVGTKKALESIVAENLGISETFQGFGLVQIPGTLLRNLHTSFSYLVQSRLKSTITVLARQHTTSENPRSQIVMDVLLPSASPIRITTIVTTFCALPQPDQGSRQINAIALPLLFEAIVDCKVLGQIVPVSLSTPGTIQGSFVPERPASFEVILDTKTLLRGMMQEARRIVRRAVAIATQVAACVTDTLPRNAPNNLVQMREKLLRDQCKNALPKSAITATLISEEKGERHALQQEVESLKCKQVLDEVMKMPPPPARLPRALSSTISPLSAKPLHSTKVHGVALRYTGAKRSRTGSADIQRPSKWLRDEKR